MASKLSERLHVVAAYEPSTINNTNATGRYIPMSRCTRMLAVLNSSAAALGKTVKLELFQAKTDAGGNAELVAGKTATFTANVKANKVLLTLTSASNTDTVSIIIYNKAGTAITTTTYTKNASGTDTFANAAALIILLNALEGVKATAAAEVVTVSCEDGYTITVTSVDVAGSVVTSTLQSTIYLDLNENDMKTSTGFLFVAPKITTTSTAGVHSVDFIMEMKDLPAYQVNMSGV
jgi:hypothetical protein